MSANAISTLVVLRQVNAFIFGSVPLKTYLPDGDIDLSLFLKSGPTIRSTWAVTLSKFLEAETGKEGPCRVRDVQVINAEVSCGLLLACCTLYLPAGRQCIDADVVSGLVAEVANADSVVTMALTVFCLMYR